MRERWSFLLALLVLLHGVLLGSSGCSPLPPGHPTLDDTNPIMELAHELRSPQILTRSDEGDDTSLTIESQVWRGQPWHHRVFLTGSANAPHADVAVILVSGSGKGESERALLAALAHRAGVRGVLLSDVPNQPLFGDLKEDKLVAYTFARYRESGDSTWPILVPMVRSVLSTMDLLSKEFGIRKFIVTGASKRGWTTWLTGSIDQRVIGIAPAVFDMLNMETQLDLMKRSYGGDSERIKPYTELGLTSANPNLQEQNLRIWFDPFTYREQLKAPKLVILGANDPYWVVDSSRLYWSQLIGPKLLLELPNVAHGALSEEQSASDLTSWAALLARGETPPQISTQCALKASLVECTVTSASKVEAVELWGASSESRDFRSSTWSKLKEQKENATPIFSPPLEGRFSAYIAVVRVRTAQREEISTTSSALVVDHAAIEKAR